jgi:hypothetical protein
MKKKLFLLFCIVYSQFFGIGQVRIAIKPIEFQQINVLAEAQGPDGLYILHKLPEFNNRNVVAIRKWDGVLWKHISSLMIQEMDTICDMIFTPAGKLYIAGKFEANVFGDTFKNIAYWHKGSWNGVTEFNLNKKRGFIINSLAWHNNRLVIGGSFDSINGNPYNNLAYVDSNSIREFKDQNLETGVRGLVRKLISREDKLFVAGNFTAGINIASIAYYQNNNWTAIPNDFNEVLNFVFFQGNNILAASKHSVDSISFELYDANLQTWKTAQNGISSVSAVYTLANYENSIYATGDFKDTLGNNNLSLLNFRNNRWNKIQYNLFAERVFAANGVLTISGTKNHALQQFAIPNYTIGQYVTGQRMIFGRVFADLNSNCRWDVNDFLIPNAGLRFKDRSQVVFSNDSGRYFYYFTGNLIGGPQIITNGYNFDYNTCINDTNDLSNTFTSLLGPVDIALQPTTITKPQLRTQIALQRGHRVAQGSRNVLVYKVQNSGLSPATQVFVQLKGAQKLKNFQSNPPFQILNDSMIGWSLNNINPMQNVKILFSYAIQDISDVPNNILEFKTELRYFNGEDTQLLSDSYAQSVSQFGEDNVAIKEQFLANKLLTEDAIIHTKDTTIYYQISFRNRLNEVVNQVVIIDTLNLQHDYKYTQEISSSHPFTTQVVQDPVNSNIGYLIWTFSNLNLTPNPSDNPEIVSDAGFIKFKFIFNSLQHGEIVKNRALVVMNGSEENATNLVVCWADENANITQIKKNDQAIIAFPNPCSSELFIQSEKLLVNTPYTILDMQGRKVATGFLHESKINIAYLHSGVYMVLLHTQNGVQSVRVVKQ